MLDTGKILLFKRNIFALIGRDIATVFFPALKEGLS